jgi:hypothetical protein
LPSPSAWSRSSWSWRPRRSSSARQTLNPTRTATRWNRDRRHPPEVRARIPVMRPEDTTPPDVEALLPACRPGC